VLLVLVGDDNSALIRPVFDRSPRDVIPKTTTEDRCGVAQSCPMMDVSRGSDLDARAA
jgi:hypothetical protein